MSSLSIDSRKKCRNILAKDEGFRENLYKDTKGFWTIGFGFNLEQNGVPIDIALEWLDYLMGKIESDLSKYVSFWYELDDARKSVLINMAYQMGIAGLLKFSDMLKALSVKDYAASAAAMKDSIWYKDFTPRASRLVNIMLSGEF